MVEYGSSYTINHELFSFHTEIETRFSSKWETQNLLHSSVIWGAISVWKLVSLISWYNKNNTPIGNYLIINYTSLVLSFLLKKILYRKLKATCPYKSINPYFSQFLQISIWTEITHSAIVCRWKMKFDFVGKNKQNSSCPA